MTLAAYVRCETVGCTNQGPTFYLLPAVATHARDRRCLPCCEWISTRFHARCRVTDLRLHVRARFVRTVA